MTDNAGHGCRRERWEEEVQAVHRWGRFSFWFKVADERGEKECQRLRELWEKAKPMNDSCKIIMDQIQALEICNWHLEKSILALCQAIGKKTPVNTGIGHMASMTEARWREVWAYYLALRDWLPEDIPNGHKVLLGSCDPDKKFQNHIQKMLGERDLLKELYVERFCLALERWIKGIYAQDSVQMMTHRAAVEAADRAINRHDPERKSVPESALTDDGDGRLIPCNHKAFRRYDLIISSIGAGKWRARMTRRGTDGLERAVILENYLAPIESWICGKAVSQQNASAREIYSLLGKPDNIKLFLASLFLSLLRAQQLAAQQLAEQRSQEAKE